VKLVRYQFLAIPSPSLKVRREIDTAPLTTVASGWAWHSSTCRSAIQGGRSTRDSGAGGTTGRLNQQT
jgi:hypothetical protein